MVRFRVFQRDNFTCVYCGRRPPEVKLHADHVVPASKGGPATEDNLVTACSQCNLQKGTRTVQLCVNCRRRPASMEGMCSIRCLLELRRVGDDYVAGKRRPSGSPIRDYPRRIAK